MRRHLIALGILAVAGWTANGALSVTAAERRAITEKDLFAFVWVADPQISPDGSRVAFVRVTVDEKKDQYDTAIWIAPTDGSEPPRAFTGGQRDTSPRWSPDGRHLVFARVAEKDGRPQPAAALSDADGRRRAASRSPTCRAGRQIRSGRPTARRSPSRPRPGPTSSRPNQSRSPKRRRTRATCESSPGRIPRQRCRRLAASSTAIGRRQIWTVAVPASGAPPAAPKRLTSGEFGASNHRWSTDGTRIFFVSDRRRESYYYANDSDLYEVAKDGGEPIADRQHRGIDRRLRPVIGRQAARVRRHPARRTRTLVQPARSLGRRSSRRHAAQSDRELRLRRQRQRRRRPAFAARPDAVPNQSGRPTDTTSSIKVGEQGNANLVRVDAASGQVTPLTKGSQEIMAFTADAGGDAARRCPFHRRRSSATSKSSPTSTGGSPKKLTGVQRRAAAINSTMTGAGGDSGTPASTGRRFRDGF